METYQCLQRQSPQSVYYYCPQTSIHPHVSYRPKIMEGVGKCFFYGLSVPFSGLYYVQSLTIVVIWLSRFALPLLSPLCFMFLLRAAKDKLRVQNISENIYGKKKHQKT